MTLRAVLFDCDGVLADTERHGHLPAFNAAFDAAGVDLRWSEQEYGELLAIGGGKERFTAAFHRATGAPPPAELVDRVHRLKTALYVDLVSAGTLPGRPGVARLIAEALDAGLSVGVCSTSAEASVRAVTRAVLGDDADRLQLVLAGDVVRHKKPSSEIYQLALERLGLPPHEVVVVEDSHIGLQAARGAGLRTVITVNGYTADEDMTAADLVVSCLGDPPDERAQVLSDPCGLGVDGSVELGHLQKLALAETGRPNDDR